MQTATRTYGTVRHVKGAWHVECEPHVLIRLKRIFHGAAKQSHGKLVLSDTEESCADLEWVLQRYPMAVEDPGRLRSRAQRHRERMSAIDAMLSRRVPPPPFDLALPPREYQRIAAAVALEGRGLLLADDVGLGKTVSAIAMLSDPRTLPALVVTLTHLPPQWVAELERFAPKLKVHVLKKATPYDLTAGRTRKGQAQLTLPERFPDVVVANYHKLSGWADTFAPKGREPIFRSVVFDEVQELRHNDTARYEAAERVAHAADFRLGLSATPIYNLGGEFHSVMNMLRPGAIGTKGEFQAEWCGGFDESGKIKVRDPKAFGTYVREQGLMLRRTRADVGRELPALTKIPHTIEADAKALERIQGAATELARIILAQGERARGQKMLASGELDAMMRQATGIAKAPFVAEFVRLLAESGEQVLLYGWHHDCYAIWRERLADLRPVMYSGTESPAQKEASKQAFLSGESKVLIMSLRAGAGLDGLQRACRTVVFGELDWSPGVIEQCIGRVHRDGQPDPVMAYLLIADSGCDPVMVDVLGVKRGQIDGIRDPNAGLVEQLSVDPGHIRRLAESYLRSAGAGPALIAVPEQADVVTEPAA